MVREQIEARGVQDPAVLEAMRAVPRHLFMEEALASQAYDDRPQPIGHGQTISQPYVVAWMTALLEILPGMRVLEIGTGSGYQAAVLAEVGAEVFSVERIKKLFMETRDRLMKMRYFGIKLKLDDGTLGWPEEAPFDRIIVTAGGPEVPKPLLEQLADPGRLVIPVGTSRRYQRMVVVEKKDGRMNERDLGPVSFVDLIGAHGWQPARAQEGGNMAGKERMSLARAWKRSPGPDTPREALVLGLKGVCMGVADIIPGVSGGTMALITGIYDQLISAVKSFDAKALGRIAALDFPGALARVHARFLAFLLTGIALALLSMARVIHFLLEAYPVQVWALFFGLILASVLVVLRRVERFGVPELLFTGAGAVISWLVVGLIPVQTPETPAFIFFSGCLAICAMILPGISGAFILLILGKYQFITGTLKNPFLPENLAIIGVFAAGCVAGVTLFSRVLDFFLKRFHAATISLLAGFMIGALRKVWPWKEVLETVTVRGKTMVVSEANVWPPDLGAGFWIALGLAVLGIVLVLILERASADRRI